MKNLLKNPLMVVLLAGSCGLLWGTAFPAIKVSYPALNIGPTDSYLQLLFAGYRFFLAGLLILITARLTGQSLRPGGRGWLGPLFLVALFQTTLQYATFYIGLSYTSGVKASILCGTSTFFAVTIAHYIFRGDRMNWQKLFGLTIGFGGMVLVNLGKGGLTLDFAFWGEGMIILSSLFAAIGAVLVKGLGQRINVVVLTGYQMVMGALMLLLLAVTWVSPLALHFNATSGWIFIWLVTLSALAFSIWNALMKHNSVGKVSVFNFLVPVFGTIASAVLLPGETVTGGVMVSLILVSLGIMVVNLDKTRDDLSGGGKVDQVVGE
ncbi:MAG TPA: DMT family transporter [Bacillota bacterium]|nr:DMT family transporter [Bacillota bacterium]